MSFLTSDIENCFTCHYSGVCHESKNTIRIKHLFFNGESKFAKKKKNWRFSFEIEIWQKIKFSMSQDKKLTLYIHFEV